MAEGEKRKTDGETERRSTHKQLFDDKLGWGGGIDGWGCPERKDGGEKRRQSGGKIATRFLYLFLW